MADNANLPIIPDKVVDRIRKGQPVALEEVSEAAAEMSYDRKAARRQPVHAEDLKPISKAAAAEWTRFDGESLPRAPQTRRVIPAPFKRPSISIQVPWEPSPTWGYCRADQVQEGDIVPDMGLIVRTETRVRYEDIDQVTPITVHHPGEDGQTVPETVEPDQDFLSIWRSGKVATGSLILLLGKGGKVAVFDPGDQVRVFRVQEEATAE